MRPIKNTIPLAQAKALIESQIKAIDRIEIVSLSEATGRVLAQECIASADVPSFARAAMDGYAVRAEDTFRATQQEPKSLTCVERVFAGQMPTHPIEPGQCSEIATGAPMPDNANAVVMVEETKSDSSSTVYIMSPVEPQQHIGQRGADIQEGQVILNAGEILNASRIGALAAIGTTKVTVYVRPRVAILSTGNEIVDLGQPLEPGQIYDINKFTLTAIVTEHGGYPEPHRTATDNIKDLSDAVEQCLESDLLVFSGGSSVGTRDFMVDVIGQKGTILFHGLAIKPGKPTVVGVINDKLIFGMPGYPTSCLSNAHILLVPVIRHLAHLPAHHARTITVPLGKKIRSTIDKHQFYTVRVEQGIAVPAFKASGDITSMSQADGYIEISPTTTAVEQGEPVQVTLF
jgi:molybdenum cofactor synthesis domain-containing protein